MREIVIGGDGFIGSRLARMLDNPIVTTRSPNHLDGRWPLDLLDCGMLPDGDISYICAGVNGNLRCEGNAQAYHVNVDATINIAKTLASRGTFVVWIGSRSIEWSNTAYSRHKQLTESALLAMDNVGVVRAGRVVTQNVDDLCATMMRVGREKRSGLTVWGTDETSYERSGANIKMARAA